MPTFNFTVSATGIAQFHDALSCLAKFDENISLEANSKELRISSLNSSKTAYASFIFNAGGFFDKYHFSNSNLPLDQDDDRSPWACRIQNRALLAVFRRRQIDSKEKQTFIERCDFELQASANEPECRLVVRFYCRLSVVKAYKLTYETTDVLHATFDKQGSKNTWTLPARTLRDIGEYFGPKTEHVDWSLSDGKVTFTSYADKIQVGKEIIRQPMHTSVALDERDFENCKLEPNQHISIHVKDFRSIVAHADVMKASVKVLFSRGQRPLQMTYGSGGLAAEFTLMTKGTSSLVTETSRANTPARGLSVHLTSQQATSTRASSEAVRERNEMPPPAPVQSRKTLPNRQSKQSSENAGAAAATANTIGDTSAQMSAAAANISHSMFFPAADDDQRWEPPNFEEDDGMVTWDNEVESVFDASTASRRRNRDTGTDTGPTSASFRSAVDNTSAFNSALFEIGPTQRLSQVKGMFD